MKDQINRKTGRFAIELFIGFFLLISFSGIILAQTDSSNLKLPILKSNVFELALTDSESFDESNDSTNSFEVPYILDPQLYDSTPDNDSSFLIFKLKNLSESEILLLNDAQDNRWDQLSLLEAALIAEGLSSPNDRNKYIQQFKQLNQKLIQSVGSENDPKSLTKSVYEFIHSEILTGQYDQNRSSLVDCLNTGVFNCVSATILFNSMAESVGLNVFGLESTGHAKSRVKYENEYLDIETTCPQWTQLPDKYEALPSFVALRRPVINSNHLESMNHVSSSNFVSTSALTLASTLAVLPQKVLSSENSVPPASEIDGQQVSVYEPQQDYQTKPEVLLNDANQTESNQTFETNETIPVNVLESAIAVPQHTTSAPLGYSYISGKRNMREISSVELIATIYYNKGVDFYQEKNFSQAIAAYIKAICLDPNNKTIKGNLNATLNNWAIQLAGHQKKYSSAILIAEYGLRLSPDFQQFQMNLPVFYKHWLAELETNGSPEEFKRVQLEYETRFPK
ncbi:MAG: tetratricopeptide repeat protein [Planctomycetia bacterium]|nr:tetratricopeptide repeat protein [Planctomycetia bacterium]